ncbi:MAG: hypothetical protein HYU64_01865 [Armatimonadetes bacterium]|nr:hypothetical protein [Armatimonadota bacterium]
MNRIKGKVRYQDIEGGIWLLEGEDGVQYQLHGGDRSLYQDGRKVTVQGQVAQDMMGIGMAGPLLEVKSYE